MSFSEEDSDIFLKPSTELIPDEYEQTSNEQACVHVFVYKEGMEKQFVDCMMSLDYCVPQKNVHVLSVRTEVMASLQRICNGIKEGSSLIILFWGLFRADRKFLLRDGTSVKLMEIWSKFVSSNCPALTDKPKIFIFNGSLRLSLYNDGMKHFERMEEDALDKRQIYDESITYNIPAEADILIVFKQNQDFKSSNEYMDSLCSNFQNYAQREDISSLLTIAHFSSRPTLISTMTKKFYLKHSPNRGIHATIKTKYSNIEIAIRKLKENIITLTKVQKKVPEHQPETDEPQDSVICLKKASSIEESLHRRVLRPDGITHFRPRSNTTSRLVDIHKILQKRQTLHEQRPPWR